MTELYKVLIDLLDDPEGLSEDTQKILQAALRDQVQAQESSAKLLDTLLEKCLPPVIDYFARVLLPAVNTMSVPPVVNNTNYGAAGTGD